MTSIRSHHALARKFARKFAIERIGSAPVALAIALAFSIAPFHAIMAQNAPTVTASVDGYTATGSGATIPESAWIPINVTRNDSALHAEASGGGGSFFTGCTIPCVYVPSFTSTSAQGFASAEPGVLRVFASDLVTALPELNGPNVPVTSNTNTVYANISVAAGFTDYVTVGSTNQPVGTPVQVPFRYAAELISNTILGYPQYSAHALSVSVSFNFPGYGAQNFSTANYGYATFTTTTLPNGNYLHSVRSDEFFVAARVGDVLPISASIGMYGSPRIVNGVTQLGVGYEFGAWADGRNTAGIWLGTLPNGMVITSASGHDYTIDPTLRGTPIAPAQVAATATAGDAKAIVAFTAPLGTGASAVTGYTATSFPGGITATSMRSPIVVLGLTNGTAYTFTVTSTNATGMSTVSSASNSITPSASLAPATASAPVIGTATAGDAQATVNFAVPTSDGGSAITGYRVTASPGGFFVTGATSPLTVTGLVNGANYTFTVTASNGMGVSSASAPSNSVTPAAAVVPTPTPTPTPTPSPTASSTTSGSGGGAASIPLLLTLAVVCWWRRRRICGQNLLGIHLMRNVSE